MLWVVGDAAVRIRRGGADQPRGVVLVRAERDRIAPALAHLAAVGAAQQRARGEQGSRFGEDRSVPLVESPGDEPGGLQVGHLVLADGDEVGLAEEDVGGLVDGVGEHQSADGGSSGVGDLVLDGRVPVELGHADQAEERQHQLVECGYRAVGEDGGPCGFDPGRQVVEDEVLGVLDGARRDVAVGQDLVVGDHQQEFHTQVLEVDAVLQGAEVVAQVEGPGRAVAGEDAVLSRVAADGFEAGGQGHHGLLRVAAPFVRGRPPRGDAAGTQQGRPYGRPWGHG
ncbi:hypothetical protein GCM10025734_33120 [Kitasatospora paranensis]